MFIYSRLDAWVLKQLPNLKLIATRSTGFDHIDAEYCREHGITVGNVPAYGSNTVVEHVFGLILMIGHKLAAIMKKGAALINTACGMPGRYRSTSARSGRRTDIGGRA